MDAVVIGLQLVALLGLGAIGILLRSYLPEYSKAKAKNHATREDIGEITGRIEEVKARYAEHAEFLRQNIALHADHVSLSRKTERDAALGFYENCLHLVIDKLTVRIESLRYDHGLNITQYRHDLNQLFVETEVAYYRLVAHVRNDLELVKLAGDVNSKIRSMRVVVKVAIEPVASADTTLILAGEEENLGARDVPKLLELAKKYNETSEFYREQVEAKLPEIEESLGEYAQALNAYLAGDSVNNTVERTGSAGLSP